MVVGGRGMLMQSSCELSMWTAPWSPARPPAGKWHNRALGMSMRVEKSTAEQVGGAASRTAAGNGAGSRAPQCCAAGPGMARSPPLHPDEPCMLAAAEGLQARAGAALVSLSPLRLPSTCGQMLRPIPLQVRARLEEAKKRKQGGESSAADFAPDGEGPCRGKRVSGRKQRTQLQTSPATRRCLAAAALDPGNCKGCDPIPGWLLSLMPNSALGLRFCRF